jgi:hypothetical protein
VAADEYQQKQARIAMPAGTVGQGPLRFAEDPQHAADEVHHQRCQKHRFEGGELIELAQYPLRGVIGRRPQRRQPGIHQMERQKDRE